jgi:hypothetical protein
MSPTVFLLSATRCSLSEAASNAKYGSQEIRGVGATLFRVVRQLQWLRLPNVISNRIAVSGLPEDLRFTISESVFTRDVERLSGTVSRIELE